jgi:N-carbamoyl-L-amino-acid hydrolase
LGNLFARWQGSEELAGAVGTGSHIDAIPHSGKFDGTVGVLGGLEAIRALQKSAFEPRLSIELLTFISEEPTRFGLGCLGSRMLSGSLSAADAMRLRDKEGKYLKEAIRSAGFQGFLEEVKLAQGYYSSFVELHTEQGPVLEKTGTPLGVVTGIAAPAALRVLIEGEGGHAGAVLMPERHDAFLGACEIAIAVEAAARGTGAKDTVGTTGLCDVFPNVANGVPSQVKLEIDIRDIELARRDSVLKRVMDVCRQVAAKRGLDVKTELVNADAPAMSDGKVVKALEEACQTEQKLFMPMVSRAYHDSLFMSRIAPTAMLFIPCKGGVSHRPDEYAAPEDIGNGVRVLARTLAALAA